MLPKATAPPWNVESSTVTRVELALIEMPSSPFATVHRRKVISFTYIVSAPSVLVPFRGTTEVLFIYISWSKTFSDLMTVMVLIRQDSSL
jgi:hypothetical protein